MNAKEIITLRDAIEALRNAADTLQEQADSYARATRGIRRQIGTRPRIRKGENAATELQEGDL